MNYIRLKQLGIYLGVALICLSTASFINSTPVGSAEDVQKINWVSIEEAQELSEQEPRKIIMDVYTDWCGWCKKMDKTTFADEKVAEYVNENFYAVKLKADSNDKVTFKGQEFTKGQLAQALRVTGYPTVVFFDESFARFQPVSGFRPADDFLKLLEAFNQADTSQ